MLEGPPLGIAEITGEGLMDTGTARKKANGVNEGTVGDMEKGMVLRTDEVAEERDLVGVYLHEISRTPLLDAAREVDLSKAIERVSTRSTCSTATSSRPA